MKKNRMAREDFKLIKCDQSFVFSPGPVFISKKDVGIQGAVRNIKGDENSSSIYSRKHCDKD